MKKFTKILALTLVLVMSVVMLASCGGPNADPEKAAKALEDAEYDVDDSKLLAPTISSLLGIKGVETVVFGEKKDEGITILYFEDKDAANEAWEKVEKYVDDMESDLDLILKKSGKMIYFGTEAAIKAAK